MRRLLLALPLLAVAIVGCGDDEPTASSGPVDVRVKAEGLAFQPDRLNAQPGAVTFELDNPDSIEHTLLIEDVDDFELKAGAGDKDSGGVDLEPGTYTVYCDVPGHREGGMEAELKVG